MLRFFKKKKKSHSSKSERYFQLKIKEVRKETGDTNSLIFEWPDRSFVYEPGQFLTLILPIKGREIRRSYSLCTSPYKNDNPAITVKRVESGIVSNYLNDHMKPGDIFEVMEPAGHFVPELIEGEANKYVMFAAGSGITPIISIIESILAVETKSHCTLVYQNRNENTVIFKERLERLRTQNPGRFEQIHVLSQPNEAWNGYRGRIDQAITSDILMDIAGNKIDRCTYFICGPSGFMATVTDTLADFEVPEKQIHKESFYTGDPKPQPSTEEIPSEQEISVKIHLDGEAYEVTVPSNKTILEAALDQDIDMPFSCQSGLCTACRGKLLNGRIKMDEDDGLSEEEINEGYILNCVSKPTGPGVEIEVG
ncbi:MAG: ferredoxin--NADP reductase [Cytophagales bacterium]|nr:ferredoxin--NADP reductase [Cytophagales bacterium]